MSYLCIDIGTTAIKAGLYQKSGQKEILSAEYPLQVKGQNAEQNAEDWYGVSKQLILKLLNGCKDEVEAICVSGQSITFVPIDKNGNVLHNAITWLDRRAQGETEEIKSQFSSEYIFSATGKKLLSAYSLPKLMWLKTNKKEIYDKTYKFLFPPDYLNYKLTGKTVTDYTVASGTMMFDINKLEWSDEILDAFMIDKTKLPAACRMGSEIGTITKETAKELGVSVNAKVILGGQDQKLAAIGAGLEGKTATVSLGTAMAVSTLQPLKDSSVFAFDGVSKIYECVLSTSGAAIKWLKGILNLSSYSQMNELALNEGNSGGVTFSPDLTLGGVINGLTLGVKAGNIIYALYEGIAKVIKGFLPPEIKRLTLFGGGANSGILCEIIAKITKRETAKADTPETALLGAAILASNGKIKTAEIKKIL